MNPWPMGPPRNNFHCFAKFMPICLLYIGNSSLCSLFVSLILGGYHLLGITSHCKVTARLTDLWSGILRPGVYGSDYGVYSFQKEAVICRDRSNSRVISFLLFSYPHTDRAGCVALVVGHRKDDPPHSFCNSILFTLTYLIDTLRDTYACRTSTH